MLRPYDNFELPGPNPQPLTPSPQSVSGVLVELRVRASLRLRNRHQREMRVPRRLELPGCYVLAKADEIRAPLRLKREFEEPLRKDRIDGDCGERISSRERPYPHRPHKRQRIRAARRSRRRAV